MKKILAFIAVVMVCLLLNTPRLKAQSNELVQLILNVEKLNQLKAILQRMKDGYEMLKSGYQAVQDIGKGQFSLHKVFLDKLMEVSPLVRNYSKVVQIISNQATIVKEYKTAFNACKNMNVFSLSDIEYMEQVYTGLTGRAALSLDELIMVITAGQVRMTDAERMQFIDEIHTEVVDQLSFLRYFNKKALILGSQKQKGLEETTLIQNLFRFQ